MLQVIVGYGVMPCQVDEFPADCERSRKGALYIRPKSSLEMTADELAFIEKSDPQLFRKLSVVPSKRRKPVPKAVAKPKPEPKKMTAKSEASEGFKKSNPKSE